MPVHDLKSVLTGSVIRAIAGIRDVGEIMLAYVTNADGDNVADIADDNSDIYVHVIESIKERPILGKLFSPMNALFRLPKTDDRAYIMKPGEVDGPGIPLIAFGGGGDANTVPSWLSNDKSGISVPEGLRIESTGDSIEIQANNGASITINKTGDISIQAGTGGTIEVKSDPTGQVKLGAVGTLPVLVQGAFDTFGVPVTQAPAAVATIVKAG